MSKPTGWVPRTAESYTAEEKVERFDRLHAFALEHYRSAVDPATQSLDEDVDAHGFELMFETMLGPEVWESYNAALERLDI
jgi:hypothetical protein